MDGYGITPPCSCSYRVSIAMARNTDNQVENKGVKLVDILHKCGSIKHLQSAFKKIRELCTPGEWVAMVTPT